MLLSLMTFSWHFAHVLCPVQVCVSTRLCIVIKTRISSNGVTFMFWATVIKGYRAFCYKEYSQAKEWVSEWEREYICVSVCVMCTHFDISSPTQSATWRFIEILIRSWHTTNTHRQCLACHPQMQDLRERERETHTHTHTQSSRQSSR